MITTTHIANEFSKKLREFSALFTKMDWKIKESYPFLYFINPNVELPNQGWKIHISCLGKEIFELLECIEDVLQNENVSFKVVASYDSIIGFNSGDAGVTQIGKIITIYPQNTDSAFSLGKKLDSIWNGSMAPSPPSDLYFRRGGNVSLRFGAINNEKVIVHHDHVTYPALIDPNGNIVPDISRKAGEQVSWAPPLPEGLITNDYLGKELDYFKGLTSERYAVVYPLIKKTFTSTLLCMDVTTITPVLLKIYCKRVDENKDGITTIDAAHNEIMIASILSEKGLAPKILATYEDEYFFYTVSEYIVGSTFAVLPKEKRIKLLPLLLEKVQQMHDMGIVHRDLKLANVMVKDDDLVFIDFEISAIAGTKKPIRCGTQSYIPPENLDSVVHSSYDCYSLGSCLIHAYVGIDAAALPVDNMRKLNAVASYIPARTRTLIKALYSSEPENRPSAGDSAKYIAYPDSEVVSVAPRHQKLIQPKIDSLIGQCLSVLQQNAIVTDNGLFWKSVHAINAPHLGWGLNLGASGRALGLLAIMGSAEDKEKWSSMARMAASYIMTIKDTEHIPQGLHTGSTGCALALGAAYTAFGNEEYLDKCYELLHQASIQDGNYDFFDGSAGMVYTAIKVFQSCGQERFLKIADHCMEHILAGRELIDGVTAWRVNRKEENPRYETGAAHGTAGIALSIALYGVERRSDNHLELAINYFKEVFDNARSVEKGCLLVDIGVKTRHPAPNTIWCHGAAGYLWCMAQIPLIFDKMQQEIDWAISVCTNISHLSNPTYCHGMAGSLELWRMVNATSLANEITMNCYHNVLYELVNISQEHEGLELFASEDVHVFSPDLWIGYLGPVSALALAKRQSSVSIISTQW